MQNRFLEEICFSKEFGRQMRFIAGPRQCGKTTLAKDFLLKNKSSDLYFNWDDKETRLSFLANQHFFYDLIKKKHIKNPWICFDEIHKSKNWKNFLKAHFDHYEKQINTIVTGGAKLDLFRRSGDSLAGRYFLFHLYPFSLSELNQRAVLKDSDLESLSFIESRLDAKVSLNDSKQNLLHLLEYSGFPEPCISGKKPFFRLWQKNYIEKLIYEDIRNLSNIKNLDAIFMLVKLLPDKVGNPLSINSIKEDLELNHETVKTYLKYLNLLYVTFQIKPYSRKQKYLVKKEEKLYFYDWTKIQDLSFRFENFIACELLSLIGLWNDSGSADVDLNYLRQKNKKEADFLILKEDKPWLMIEVKLSQTDIDPHLYTFSENLGGIPIIQIVLEGDSVIKKSKNSFVIPVYRFF